MSNHDKPHDSSAADAQFDEFLQRGSVLSQEYRQLEQEEVPAALDEKILMRARNAVINAQPGNGASVSQSAASEGSKVVTHRSWWNRWNKPLALAASLMLAVTAIYRAGYQNVDQISVPSAPVVLEHADNEAPVASSRGAAAEDKVELENATPPTTTVTAERALQAGKPAAAPPDEQGAVGGLILEKKAMARDDQGSIEAPAAAQPVLQTPVASAVAPAAAEPKVLSDSVLMKTAANNHLAKREEASTADAVRRAPVVTGQSTATPAKSDKETDKPGPEQTLQRIRDLRKQGKKQLADQAWKQFLHDFPYYEVAADDPARGPG